MAKKNTMIYEPPYDDPFKEDEHSLWRPELITPEVTTQTTQAGTAEPREYTYLTGEKFFTEPYQELGNEWFEPYYGGGQYGLEDLSTMYAGIPVVSGYYDASGKFVPERSLYNQASQLSELRNVDVPAFEDWLAQNYPESGFQPDLTQTGEYQGVQDLVTQLLNGQAEEDLQAGMEQAAIMQGFPDLESYLASITGTREQLEQGVMAAPGIYGTEFEAASRRAHSLEVQQLIDSNQQIIEALGTKSSAAAYSKLSEVSSQIANTNAQYELQLAEQDLLMRQIEYEAMSNRLQQMQAQGLAVQEQYLTQLTNNRLAALQGYAQNLSAVVQTNQNYFTMYEQELKKVELHAQTVYQSIMADIGMNQAAMEQANEAYEAYMAPILDQINIELLEAQIDEATGVDWGGAATGALGGAAAGAYIGSVVPGIGTAIGAILGGLLGFFGGLFG